MAKDPVEVIIAKILQVTPHSDDRNPVAAELTSRANKAKKAQLCSLSMGYRLICERHGLKEFYNTLMEAKAAQIKHQREKCLESEIKKPGQK